MPRAAGRGRPSCLSFDGDFAGQDGPGRGAVDDDVVRLVGLQQFLVDGHRVVHCGGEGILGREPVEDGHHLDLGKAGYRNGLGVGARVGVEAAAVQVEQDLVAVGRRAFRRG